MDEIQQAKQSLQIYLQSNSSYIEQKVYNQFNVECIQNKTLQTLNIDKMKKTIHEIFDFGNNEAYHYFFSHLQSNIKNYIKEQYSSKAIPSFFVLDIDKLIDIIKYCINHGFDENARKELKERAKLAKKQPPKQPPKQAPIQSPKPAQPIPQVVQEKPKQKPKEKPKVVFVEEVKKIQPPKDEFAHIKSKVSTFLQRDLMPEKKQFKIQKYSMPQLNVMPRYLVALQKAPVIKEEVQESRIVVSALDNQYLNAHRKILRERFEKLFNFYCCQQQSLGQGPTFDRIKDQGQLMNLGKFMQFCQSTQIFNCKDLSKEVLMAEFKRWSEGKLDISFQMFQKIVIKLDEKYLKAMGNDSANNPVPTYEARLMLNEPNKLGELKKHRNLIFGTRTKEGRQVKDWASTSRYTKKELTAHSGRFSSDLSIDIKQKLEPSKSENKAKPKPIKLSQATIQLNQLKKLKLPKISWIMEQEQEKPPIKPHKRT